MTVLKSGEDEIYMGKFHCSFLKDKERTSRPSIIIILEHVRAVDKLIEKNHFTYSLPEADFDTGSVAVDKIFRAQLLLLHYKGKN